MLGGQNAKITQNWPIQPKAAITGKKQKNHNDTIFIFILGYYLKDTIMFLVKKDYLVHF